MTSGNRTRIPLGEGLLAWPTEERSGNRYGCVTLDDPNGQSVSFLDPPVGQRGWLLAEVLETRESPHMGDVARGFFPETPEVGDRYVLGSGTLWTDYSPVGHPVIGLVPDDAAAMDWLDPDALYRVHYQTVRLLFVPDGEAQ